MSRFWRHRGLDIVRPCRRSCCRRAESGPLPAPAGIRVGRRARSRAYALAVRDATPPADSGRVGATGIRPSTYVSVARVAVRRAYVGPPTGHRRARTRGVRGDARTPARRHAGIRVTQVGCGHTHNRAATCGCPVAGSESGVRRSPLSCLRRAMPPVAVERAYVRCRLWRERPEQRRGSGNTHRRRCRLRAQSDGSGSTARRGSQGSRLLLCDRQGLLPSAHGSPIRMHGASCCPHAPLTTTRTPLGSVRHRTLSVRHRTGA